MVASRTSDLLVDVTQFTDSKTYDSLRRFCINYRIENDQHKKVKGAMSRTFGVTFNDQKTLDQYNGKVEIQTQFCTQKLLIPLATDG